jgi:hypothetical protein
MQLIKLFKRRCPKVETDGIPDNTEKKKDFPKLRTQEDLDDK